VTGSTAMSIESLVSPYGLVASVARLPSMAGDPALPTCSGSVGNLGYVLDGQRGRAGWGAVQGTSDQWSHDPTMGNIDGAGGDLDPRRAAFLAVAESLERYSSCAFRSDRVIWATARELGDDAVDLSSWPACSSAELADPACTLLAPDLHGPMRWVRGWSLTAHRARYVPSMMVWLKNPPQSRAERFSHSVSTGCATHTDPVAAVVGGLLEVVERDAIALTWLHRLRLPRLEVDPTDLTEAQREAVRLGTVPHLRTELFDATTDLGIPVIYGVALADHDPVLAQLVTATCDPDPAVALVKLYREAASVRIALRAMTGPGGRSCLTDTVSVVAGALLMGRPAARGVFDFLLTGPRPTHRLADLPRPDADSPAEVLRWLLSRVEGAGHEVIVVDITTDEAAQAGAVVVRVLVPGLMPVSFDAHARYLAHPRLYEAPVRMGHPVTPEADLNPLPQPFA
jgi:ribosomal protein S12 methylthiotransferase accessory factor